MYAQAMNNTQAPGAPLSLESYEIPADVANEQVVIFMRGINLFGDAVFSYVEITLAKLKEMKINMDSNKNFRPADYGTVLAAGRGEPSKELKEEMAREHNLVDVPMPKVDRPVIKPAPRFSYNDDD